MATAPQLPPVNVDGVDRLARRIQEVEQEIARLQQERARGGEKEGRERIAALEARVHDAEARLATQLAVRRKAARPTSLFRGARNHLYFLGALFTGMGLVMTGAALHLRTEWLLVVAGTAPGLVGLFMIVKASRAKTLADLEAGDL